MSGVRKGSFCLTFPKADGTIPQEQRDVLAAIGAWISKHGEAVYDTRAYVTYGYGEAAFKEGHFGGQAATIEYNEKDIRFTTSKDKKRLYIFSLGQPDPDSAIAIRTPIEGTVKRVSVVGSGVELKWSIENSKLEFQTPQASEMDQLATVFRVEFE